VNQAKAPIGGVLSDQAIYDLVHAGETEELIARDDFQLESLQPASYNPRIARDGLITPEGDKFKPGCDGPWPTKVVLYSGDAAMFSTVERFLMPANVAGNITVKNRQATNGLLLLSGLLIDPDYGADTRDDENPGRRLYLHVANIGKEPITIEPGQQIARIQFLHVCGGQRRSGAQPDSPPRIEAADWNSQQQPSLGFLTDLKVLKEKVDNVSYQAQAVIVGGILVLAVTLLGLSLSTILSIGQSTNITKELHSLKPSSTGGTVLLIATVMSSTLWVVMLSLLALNRSSGKRTRK
jgi:deoxycytidine triphosphate deaminase